LLAVVLVAACAAGQGERGLEARLAREADALAAALARAAPPPDGALRIQLAFGAEADLDLYVTDPQQETVYFANTPSRSGGALEADLRCDAPSPRIERVVFPAPEPGRYRVGVDFPARCDGRRRGGPVALLVVLEHGALRHEQRGVIHPLRFEPVVLEVEIGPR
jgi:hypothetical protein